MGMMEEEAGRRKEKAEREAGLDVEIEVRKAELEKARLEAEITKVKSRREADLGEGELVAGGMRELTQVLSKAFETKANMMRDIARVGMVLKKESGYGVAEFSNERSWRAE